MPAITLYPRWKQAVQDIVDGGLLPGRVLTTQDLMSLLCIDEPTNIEEYQKAQLAFLNTFYKVKDELLTSHLVDLETLPGIGYKIIEPAVQTKMAAKDGAKAIVKAMRSTRNRMVFLNTTLLTFDQRRENDDSLVQLSRLSALVGKPSRFLTLTV